MCIAPVVRLTGEGWIGPTHHEPDYANWPSPPEGLQRRIHCIDLLGDGFLLRLQSFDARQLFIDFMLALRQLLERRLQVLFDAGVWCNHWRRCWGAHLRGRGRGQCRYSRGFDRVTVPDVR